MLFSYVLFPFFVGPKKNECFPGGHLTWAASPEGTLATPQPGRFHHVTSPSPTSSRPGNASRRITRPTGSTVTGQRRRLNHPVGLVIEPSTVGMLGWIRWDFFVTASPRKLKSFDQLAPFCSWKNPVGNTFLRPKPLNSSLINL